MKILLLSSEGIGAWNLLRLMREGHDCDWMLIEDKPRRDKVLKGLIPPPLERKPPLEQYDLILFDSSGNPELAEEAREAAPVLGDGLLASRLEDDRLYGIQIMEECGIEVPAYETFDTPEEAKKFIEAFPKRYVYKPFVEDGEDQESECTYVADSAEDLLKNIDHLYHDSHEASFLLQEVVQGVEIAANGYFDGDRFHFVTHTLEEKKFMNGGYGPNTGCSGNLIYAPNGSNKLLQRGLYKLIPFLRDEGYRGPIDLNAIVNENHLYGLEFTPRFGYDSTATEFHLLDGDLGKFLYDIASAPEGGLSHDPVPPLRAPYSVSERLSMPPYPEEGEWCKYDGKLPIKGLNLEDAWLNCYLWDAMMDTRKSGEEGLVTVGINGIVACPLACGSTPESAWKAIDRVSEAIKFPNLQCRTDLDKATIERLNTCREWRWL